LSNENDIRDTFQSLVEELVNDTQRHVSHCADEGSFCVFCSAPWGYWPSPPTDHSPNCWLVRAEKLLAIKQVD